MEVAPPRDRIAATVVLYNPDTDIEANIRSYYHGVGSIYLMDNSSVRNQKLIDFCQENPKVRYFHDGLNKGMAKTLNLAVEQARMDGHHFLLTMDQDSHFHNFDHFLDIFRTDDEWERVAIYSPWHETGFDIIKRTGISYAKKVMTSGNILNLSIHTRIGGFDERLFIDKVDDDYCMTANEAGFKVKLVRSATLIHRLGDATKTVGKRLITNHSAERRYYMARNTLYFAEKHFTKSPRYVLRYIKEFLIETILVMLHENERPQKLKMTLLGLWHYLKRVGGMYPRTTATS